MLSILQIDYARHCSFMSLDLADHLPRTGVPEDHRPAPVVAPGSQHISCSTSHVGQTANRCGMAPQRVDLPAVE